MTILKICIVGASGKLGQYMVRNALENDELIHEAPAIVGCQAPSALAYKDGATIDEPDP